MIKADELAARCAADGEFRLASRHWTGGLRLVVGDEIVAMALTEGKPRAGEPDGSAGVITLEGSVELWSQMLAAVPARFFNDVTPAQAAGLVRGGDDLLWWQYAPAVQRAVELLRADGASDPEATQPVARREVTAPRFDAPVGRYVHLDIAGHDHRVYFEEAGAGIPILAQHTAGSHGVQWRHLFERAEITDRFRLIAYDLPFHGKSVPPTSTRWWEEQYRLTGSFLRAVPVALAEALALDRPVFMGCSVGGLLALDLALRHPDVFRAVIAVEGALRVEGDWTSLTGFWDPRVSNETKARMMEGLMSPTSPVANRKETVQAYAAGWPPAFLGDLWYYLVEFDLRDEAANIDTSKVGVHILSGEYDYSATLEHGLAAHQAIAGSTYTPMPQVGHFPMSEAPDRFVEHLAPILASISDRQRD